MTACVIEQAIVTFVGTSLLLAAIAVAGLAITVYRVYRGL